MRSFNFNDIEAPRLRVTFRNGEELELEIPTVSLIERLRSGAQRLSRSITEKNLGDIRKYYELAAELLSCNTENRRFTAEALEQEQRISMEGLVLFFTEYLAFVNGAGSAKN